MFKPHAKVLLSLLEFLGRSTPEDRDYFFADLRWYGWALQHKPGESRPHWDKHSLKLKLGSKLIRRFREQAKNQIAILDAFEKRHWCSRISIGDYDIRLRGQPLSDAIYRLNKYQNALRFTYSGKRRNIDEEYIQFRILKKMKNT